MKSFIDSITKIFISDVKIYGDQINRDMAFWIKYRPSRWATLLPNRHKKIFILFHSKKKIRLLFIYPILIFFIIFLGFLPTINFVFSNFWRLWLIPILVCLSYWILAVLVIYLKIIILLLRKLMLVIIDKIIYR